jgi:hypothetical protein
LKKNKVQEEEWREILKRRVLLGFLEPTNRDPSKRDWDHSRPSDLGKVARRLVARCFGISEFRAF